MRNLRLFVMCVVAALTSAVATAQGVVVGGGVKAGVQFADVPLLAQEFKDEGLTNIGWRIGLIAGGYAKVNFNEKFAFQPEVLYSQKGGLRGTEPRTGHDIELRLDYIEIPLLLRWQTRMTGPGPFLMAGPSFDINVRAKGYDSGSQTAEEDLKDAVNTMDTAIVVAGGMTFGRGFLIEGRYSEGLTEVLKFYSGAGSHRNRAFSVLAGFAFK